MFKINDDYWKIVFVSPYNHFLYKGNNSYALGACIDTNKTIYINRELSLSKLKQVLSHEITHAAMFSYDVHLSDDQEELLADLLATYGQEIITITNEVFYKIKKG